APRGRLGQAIDGTGAAPGVQGAHAHLWRAGAPLPRHAGSRIYGRAGKTLEAADACGQAPGETSAEDRGRPGEPRMDFTQRSDGAARDQRLHPTIDPNAERKLIASGLPASPGAASGEIVFSADEAETLKAKDKRVILVRVETSPEDIHGMHAAEGILTTRGGM